jgi:hypothetical protein
MPYHIVKCVGMKNGYYVSDNTGKYYSKNPITLEKAKKQLIALNIALSRA